MGERYCLYMQEMENNSTTSKSGNGKNRNRFPSYLFFGTPILLIRRMLKNGGIPVSRWKIVFRYLLKSFWMLPASAWEYLFLSKKINARKIDPTPVFIIGHYRSGTTFLHKVLASDPSTIYPATFDFLFPYHAEWLRKPLIKCLHWFINTFRIQHPHFNHYLVNPEDPLEEDMITISRLMPQSAFWGEIFPHQAERYFDEQLFFKTDGSKEAWKQGYLYLLKKTGGGKNGRMLLKNPPNTARVKAILEIFPDAKFIFIYRNPYQVYYSTVSLWKRTLEKHYTLQKVTDQQRDKIIFDLYSGMMHRYLEDRKFIPKGNLVEVRYENFEKQPFTEAKRIYRELNLPGFEIAEAGIKKQLDKEKNYKKYSYSYDATVQARIREHWSEFIDRWGYSPLETSYAGTK